VRNITRLGKISRDFYISRQKDLSVSYRMILDFGRIMCGAVDSMDPTKQYVVKAQTESRVHIFIHLNAWSFDAG
jgi:hypothetical protein